MLATYCPSQVVTCVVFYVRIALSAESFWTFEIRLGDDAYFVGETVEGRERAPKLIVAGVAEETILTTRSPAPCRSASHAAC